MSTDTRIRIGVLTRSHGLDGAVRCTVDGVAVPVVETPCDAWVGYSAAFLSPVRMVACRTHGNPSHGEEMICRFEGVTTREDAAAFADKALFLPIEAIRYDNAYAHPLLVGYDVIDEAGEPLGSITALIETPAHLVWQIALENREWLLPAIDEFVIGVDHEQRRATVRPIPGMLGDADDDDGAG